VSASEDRPDTRLVRAGRRPEWTQGLVNPPVARASTILFDSVADMHAANPPRSGTLHYGRNGTATAWSLAEALSELEPGAATTMLYPSGSAAVAAALLSVVEAGDHLLVTDSVYGPTRFLCDTLLKRFGVETQYYDPLIGRGIEALITDRTRAIFMESPGSLTFEVQDVPGICEVARARGIVTLLDNTWATPLYFPALTAGVDLSILACTKYIAGHSDVMLGSVTAASAQRARLAQADKALGQMASPDDCFLAARGLRTLGLRLERHQASGLRIARWLADRKEVARVLHPALADCPGHEHWARDFKGASGVFAFELDGGDDQDRARLIDGLRHFGIGYSWGGFESLALPVDPAPLRTATRDERKGPLVRLSIGLEDPDDLIEDLEAGLLRLGGKG
jgi:cysteine-S-conjugate beta-lyase